MSSIHDLPPEIFQLFRHLGFSELRKIEGCCLTISKWWYELAREVLFEDLVFPFRSLGAVRTRFAHPNAEPAFRPYVKRISILLRGPRYRDPTNTEAFVQHDLDIMDMKLFWLNIEGGIDVLIKSLPHCPRLTTLSIQVWEDIFSTTRQNGWLSFFSVWSPERLLDQVPRTRISHLILDTCGSNLLRHHSICDKLAQVIPLLKSARIRMCLICPRIYDFPHEMIPDSRLERLVVNLNLNEQGLDRLPERSSQFCSWSYWHERCLFSEMTKAAATAAASLPRIRDMQVLSRRKGSAGFVSHDCITGNEAVLVKLEDWR